MSDDMCKKDIRALLKTFGVMADEAIVGHIAKNPNAEILKLKVTLEDMTDYGGSGVDVLELEVTKDIHCK